MACHLGGHGVLGIEPLINLILGFLGAWWWVLVGLGREFQLDISGEPQCEVTAKCFRAINVLYMINLPERS